MYEEIQLVKTQLYDKARGYTLIFINKMPANYLFSKNACD
jgi:hypothetical protein